jgi:hypothetical protein
VEERVRAVPVNWRQDTAATPIVIVMVPRRAGIESQAEGVLTEIESSDERRVMARRYVETGRT